jgi:predicted TIM-barrel fold metal-dependent hydrolase
LAAHAQIPSLCCFVATFAVGQERAVRHRILVQNAEAFYGFPKTA